MPQHCHLHDVHQDALFCATNFVFLDNDPCRISRYGGIAVCIDQTGAPSDCPQLTCEPPCRHAMSVCCRANLRKQQTGPACSQLWTGFVSPAYNALAQTLGSQLELGWPDACNLPGAVLTCRSVPGCWCGDSGSNKLARRASSSESPSLPCCCWWPRPC